jgi:hypothetical protein
MQASVAKDPRYHEGTLHTATFLLTDFGRAVPYKDIMPGLPASGTTGDQASGPQQLLQRYNKDGVVVFSDPTYQAPEVRAGGTLQASYSLLACQCVCTGPPSGQGFYLYPPPPHPPTAPQLLFRLLRASAAIGTYLLMSSSSSLSPSVLVCCSRSVFFSRMQRHR